MSLADSIKICVDGAVSVGVTLQAESRQEVHGGGSVEQSTVLLNVDNLPVGEVARATQHVEEGSTGAPRELVTKGVVGALRCRRLVFKSEQGFNIANLLFSVAPSLKFLALRTSTT